MAKVGIENLKKAVRMENPRLKRFCAACFDGDHITGDVTPEMLKDIEEARKAAKERQLELNM